MQGRVPCAHLAWLAAAEKESLELFDEPHGILSILEGSGRCYLQPRPHPGPLGDCISPLPVFSSLPLKGELLSLLL